MTELDDDREAIEPEALDEDADDPAAAFDALRQTVEDIAGDLRREMTTIRKGVEAAFEEFDRHGPPQDYKPELAQLVQQLGHVAERLQGVEQSPILRNGPEHYARALERSGEGLVQNAARALEKQARDLERAGLNLAEYTKSAYDRKSQDFRMWMAGLVGLFVGIFLILLLPRFLPFSADTHVASLIMGESRWSAGLTMMQAHNEGRFNDFLYADELVRANQDAIAACYQAARNGNAAESCTITVAAPAQQPAE